MRLIGKIWLISIIFISFSTSLSAQGIPAGASLDAPQAQQEPVAEQPASVSSPAPSTVSKHVGPPSILIARPIYAPYSNEEKTMYISSISEAYFYLKMSAFPGFQIISKEKLSNTIQNYRDFTRRVSRSVYIDAAQKTGASYLVYQEYEPSGKNVRYNIEVYSISDNNKIFSKNFTINLQEFEKGLEECVVAVANALSINVSDNLQDYLSSSIIGSNQKAIETFGNIAAASGNLSKSKSSAISDFEKAVNNNSKMLVSKYIAASIFAHAEQYEKATRLQKEIISEFGRVNPSLYLDLANYYRQAGNYNDALDAIDNASKDDSFKPIMLREKAGIYEAKGDLQKAKSAYESILNDTDGDGEIFFKLALVSIGLNDLSAAASYLSKANDAGYQLNSNNYYELGVQYMTISNGNDKAIDAFKQSLQIQQDNENAWSKLATLYEKMNRKSDVADCYVSLFQINNDAYKDELINAATIYEGLGDTEKAKDAYSLYLARKFVNPTISVKLAKLEAQSGNCDKASDLIINLDTLSSLASDIHEINQKCGRTERHVSIATNSAEKGKSPVVGIWRVLSGLVTIGAAGVGYYFDTQVSDKMKKYHDPKNHDLNNIAKLHSDAEDFKNYRNMCYAAAGVGAVSLTLSITLPIIFSKK